jgi:hypothetical protein
MNAVEFIIKALEIVGIPQEYFYSINVMQLHGEVTLQGEYNSRNVAKLISNGFSPKIEGSGYTVAEIPGTSETPKIRVVLT